MAFGDKCPAQDKLATSSCYVYDSRIINCRNNNTVSQYGVSPHVWKQWLSMSNMCKPVDPRRSFADVLKTCPSKHKNTSVLMTTGKSKATILSKPYVHQALNKVTFPGQGKPPSVHKSVYSGHTADPAPCQNRFDPLKHLDTQESEDQDKNCIVGFTGYKVKSKVKIKKHSKVQTQNVHKMVQQDVNSQTSNDMDRPVDSVPCHGRFDPSKVLHLQDGSKNRSRPSSVVIENNDATFKVDPIKNCHNEPHEQDGVEQFQQESEFEVFDRVTKSRLKPLPKCTAQLGSNFGAMSLTPLQTYTGPPTYNPVINDPLLLHKRVRESCLPNYMGIRVPVTTNLNIANWRSFLVDYWDDQLVDLLEFGFPLDFDRSLKLLSVKDNHKSAIDYEEHVNHYLQEELDHGAILGPFKNKPIKLHVSPFMTREKPDSQWCRTIVDLSWPPGASVNAGVQKDIYLNSKFTLNYPSVDQIVDKIIQLGPGSLIYKIDISRAFRQLKVDPGDIDLLGLKMGDYFIDQLVPFGYRNGSFFFEKVTDSIRFIMNKNGF